MNIGALEFVLGSQTGLNTTAVDVITGSAVSGVTTIRSNSFKLKSSTVWGVAALCQGANPQIQIQLEESFYSVGLNGLTEGQASSFYVVPDAFPDIFPQISDNNWHICSQPLTPIPMSYGRFKVNGLSGNGSGVTVAIALFRQEPGRFL